MVDSIRRDGIAKKKNVWPAAVARGVSGRLSLVSRSVQYLVSVADVFRQSLEERQKPYLVHTVLSTTKKMAVFSIYDTYDNLL